jgi:integration host factor subunit beta
MTRSQLIEALAAKHRELPEEDVRFAINAVIGALAETLAKGDRIELRGFGSFDLTCRPARVSRNPRTGEAIKVPRKYVPHFRAGKELKDRINDEGA